MANKKILQNDPDLVIREPGKPFYKAFIIEKEPSEMQLDVSGDTFSNSIEDAIRALFQHLSMDKLLQFPVIDFFFNMKPMDVDRKNINQLLKKVLVVKLRANYGAEMEDATAEYDSPNLGDVEFYARLKSLTEGYSMGIQDYMIEELEMNTKKQGETPHLVTITLVVEDTERMNPEFPQTLTVKG